MNVSDIFSHTYFMRLALKEAEKAYEAGEVPVGAIVVCDNKIIGKGHNLTERLHDVTAHAEMQAITAASHFMGSKYLIGCRMYVTLEPCVMCAGALYWSQLDELIFAASDAKRGFIQAGIQLHPKTAVVSGIEADASTALLKSFFSTLRN